MDWDIVPSHVRAVLRQFDGQRPEIASATSDLAGDLSTAATSSGGLTYGSSSTGAVGSAVQRFAARVNSCMHNLDGDSSASSEGAGTVTAVYVTGDAAMEATATTALHRGAGEPPHWPGLNRI